MKFDILTTPWLSDSWPCACDPERCCPWCRGSATEPPSRSTNNSELRVPSERGRRFARQAAQARGHPRHVWLHAHGRAAMPPRLHHRVYHIYELTCCTPTGQSQAAGLHSAPRTAYDPPKKSTMIYADAESLKELRVTPTREIKTLSQNSVTARTARHVPEAPQQGEERGRHRQPGTLPHGQKISRGLEAPHLNSSSTGCATGNRSASRCSESRDRLSCTILP